MLSQAKAKPPLNGVFVPITLSVFGRDEPFGNIKISPGSKIPASGATHGPYCGTGDDLPVLYSFRGGSLTLLFTTDHEVARTGFNITYTAFSKLTQLGDKSSKSRDVHLMTTWSRTVRITLGVGAFVPSVLNARSS